MKLISANTLLLLLTLSISQSASVLAVEISTIEEARHFLAENTSQIRDLEADIEDYQNKVEQCEGILADNGLCTMSSVSGNGTMLDQHRRNLKDALKQKEELIAANNKIEHEIIPQIEKKSQTTPEEGTATQTVIHNYYDGTGTAHQAQQGMSVKPVAPNRFTLAEGKNCNQKQGQACYKDTITGKYVPASQEQIYNYDNVVTQYNECLKKGVHDCSDLKSGIDSQKAELSSKGNLGTAATPQGSMEEMLQNLEKEGNKLNSDDIIAHGTKQFRECQSAYQAAADQPWNEMFSSKSEPVNLTKDHFQKMVVILMGARYKEKKENIATLIKYGMMKARACAMFAFTAGENFASGEKKWKEDDYKPNAQVQKSFDGRIKCSNVGPETIDYDECMNVLNAYNGAQIVQTGNDAVQQFRTQSYQQDQQLKMMNANPTEEDTSTLALKAQKDGIGKLQDMAEERRALQAAKLLMMVSLAKQMPQNADAIDLCSTNKSGAGKVDELLRSIASIKIEGDNKTLAEYVTEGAGTLKVNSAEEECQLSFNLTTAHGILQNQSTISTAYAIAAEAGVEVAKEQVAVTMLGKQKKLLGSIINKVEDADVIDLPEGFASQEELMNFCDLNPMAVECNGLGTGFTTHIGGGGAISINGSIGTNTADAGSGEGSAIDVGNGGANSAIDPEDIATSTVGGSIDKASGFVDGPAAKAKVTSAQVGSGAGGGGAGGASAAGLSGGSGSNGAAPSSGSRYKSPKISYTGGGRSLSFSGGSGAKKSSNSKDTGNPFAKMFGKNKGAGNVINFRDLASQGIGGKKGNIFERITNKYSEVNKDDRLLKYSTIDKE
ncbi:hypothetical protein [Bacteriovorax sp. Seq25_V]|uniref:hypothetical protein n=1 Tax=Bacteriovorax sp. Seq25_V TaxID=1201288 RepID=UPI00038A073B|nr:hypothetical protein [Bacteriovorax sp. Seq25_V]EQC48038.1 hypothetical protein M900_1102 [Bacteriovorax sp. Seq25_V]